MNNLVLNDLNINQQQQTNDQGFIAKAFNKVVKVVSSEKFILSSVLGVINHSIISASGYFGVPFVAILPLAICASYVAEEVIHRIYEPASTISPINFLGLIDTNNRGDIIAMIRGNHEPSAQIHDSRVPISINITYDQLQELPDNYYYSDNGVCCITLGSIKKGDAVCCDRQLYSFKALKSCYEKHRQTRIPHSRNPIIWHKNVYKLPGYGEDPNSN